MTTCPNCKRPFLTAAEWDALPDGALVPGDRCRSDAGYDWSCDRLGVDLRAKADAALLAAARCFPPGFLAAVAAVLVEGARVNGCQPWESGGGQTVGDHLEHAYQHAARSVQDHLETGRASDEDLTHAAARLALAWGSR